jgi:hypothetical protein
VAEKLIAQVAGLDCDGTDIHAGIHMSYHGRGGVDARALKAWNSDKRALAKAGVIFPGHLERSV